MTEHPQKLHNIWKTSIYFIFFSWFFFLFSFFFHSCSTYFSPSSFYLLLSFFIPVLLIFPLLPFKFFCFPLGFVSRQGYPLANMQFGMAGTWMIPAGVTYDVCACNPQGGFGTSCCSFQCTPYFQTLEGGPGYWVGEFYVGQNTTP